MKANENCWKQQGADVMAVKPVPENFHTVTPYLTCGDGVKALEFYKAAFGAREMYKMLTPDGRLGHAEIRIGDSAVMLGGECLEYGNKSPQTLGGTPVNLYVYVEDVDTAFERAVAAGAKVRMPVMNMFYGDRTGQLEDPFGHVWSLATHVEDVAPEELDRRAREMFAQKP